MASSERVKLLGSLGNERVKLLWEAQGKNVSSFFGSLGTNVSSFSLDPEVAMSVSSFSNKIEGW